MIGTIEGGKKAAATNRARHGADFYRLIGTKGGANGQTGGFFDRDLARRAGAIDGRISKADQEGSASQEALMRSESELSRYKLRYKTPSRGEGYQRLINEVVRSLQAGRRLLLPAMPRFGRSKK